MAAGRLLGGRENLTEEALYPLFQADRRIAGGGEMDAIQIINLDYLPVVEDR